MVETFHGKATDVMQSMGIANWALSLAGSGWVCWRCTITALPAEPEDCTARQQDATDRCRRARPDPRSRAWRTTLQRIPPSIWLAPANQLRRFVDQTIRPARRREQQQDASRPCASSTDSTSAMRQDHHRCAVNEDGSPINDCLGHPNGTLVDNIEDVDTKSVIWRSIGVRMDSRFPKRSSWCSF